MRRISIVLTAVLMLASPAMAQETAEGVSHASTVFGSFGGLSDGIATIHFGGGEEVIWPSGFGFGADVGYITSTTDFKGGLGLLSGGPLYRFRTSGRYKPYVRGGVSLAFRELFEKLLERLEAEAANDRYMTVFNRTPTAFVLNRRGHLLTFNQGSGQDLGVGNAEWTPAEDEDEPWTFRIRRSSIDLSKLQLGAAPETDVNGVVDDIVKTFLRETEE